MHPDIRPLTCTSTPDGLLQWTVQIMGLTYASQQFQAMIEDRLQLVRAFASVYVDYIIVSTRADEYEDFIEKHYDYVRHVL